MESVMVEATGELNSHRFLKVPIAMVGSWPHPTYGKVEFTNEDLDAAIVNFNTNALGFEPHLSFGHLDEEPNSTDSARNRGGLKYLMKDGDRLDGYFSVPSRTAEVVSEEGYTHASGEFIRNLMDKNSGEHRGLAISRVALTNTPYLPWGEEGKIQLLSQTGNTISDLVTSVVKLSTSIVDATESSPVTEAVGVDSMADMTTEQVPAQNTAVATPPVVAVPVELAPVITPVAGGIDIDALTASIIARMKAEKDVATEKADALLAAMGKEVAALKEQLAKTQAEASTFTSYATRAAEDAEKVHLMSMGASATLVNNYSAIKKALESQSTVVKLSQAGVEKESPLMDSIRELLEGALRQTPVVTTQMGLTGGTGEQQDGVQGYLERVAEANRQKANKVKI